MNFNTKMKFSYNKTVFPSTKLGYKIKVAQIIDLTLNQHRKLHKTTNKSGREEEDIVAYTMGKQIYCDF